MSLGGSGLILLAKFTVHERVDARKAGRLEDNEMHD